jgi:hypothetical protein
MKYLNNIYILYTGATGMLLDRNWFTIGSLVSSVEKHYLNHCVKQITENILELNLSKNYLYLVFCSIKIFSNLKGSSSKQLLIPNLVKLFVVLSIHHYLGRVIGD